MSIPENDKDLKTETDKRLAEALKNVDRANFEKEIRSLKKTSTAKGKSAAVFQLRDRVLGSKKSEPEATVLKDPKTGKLVDSPDEIKKVSLQYCRDLLTKRPPRNGYKNVIERKKKLHKKNA